MEIIRIDPKRIDAARALASNPRQTVFYCAGVNKINITNGKTKPRILAITDQSIIYFLNESKPKQHLTCYWTGIKSYSSDENKLEIDLTFENTSIKFSSPDYKQIQIIIIDILRHVLSSDEWNSLQIEEKYTIPKYKDLPSATGIISRYLSMLLQMGEESPKGIETQIKDYIATDHKTFQLLNDPELSKFLIMLGEALKPYSHLESLIMPNYPNELQMYNDLAQILVQHPPIKHISISNPPDMQFFPFCDSLKTSEITGLTFNNMKLSQDQFSILQESLINIPFRSLSFQNVFSPKIYQFFYTDFLTGYITSRLTMLNLDHNKNIEIDKILKDLPVICSLSFASCNLDISETLDTIGRAGLSTLTLLNLSGNYAQNFFSNSTQCPYELTRLDLNDVTWSSGVLPSFFKYITTKTFPKGLKLFVERVSFDFIEDSENEEPSKNEQDDVVIDIPIENEDANDENEGDEQKPKEEVQTKKASKKIEANGDWPSADDVFQSATTFPIVELGWSGNPITQAFIDFLVKNERLTTLFLSETFSHEANSFDLFVSSINKLTKLTNLVMKGSNDFELGSSISSLLTALQEHPTLTLLDISNQNIGNEGITAVTNLIQSNDILQIINFDGSNVTDFDSIVKLIKKAEEKQRAVSISYPYHDIKNLLAQSLITEHQIDTLKEKLYNLRHFVRNISKPILTIDHDFKGLFSQKTMKRGVRAASMKSKKSEQLEQLSSKNVVSAETGDELSKTSTSLFDYPFVYFLLDFTDEFPLYVTDDLLKEFQTMFHLKYDTKRISPKKSKIVFTNTDEEFTDFNEKQRLRALQREEKEQRLEHNETPIAEFIDDEEEEEIESPEQQRLNELYEEMGYKAPKYSVAAPRMKQPDDTKCIDDINEQFDFTSCINALVPK